MKGIKKIIAILAATLISTNVYAVTVDAGDYTRLPDGTNLAVLYMQHTKGNNLYSNGNKLSSNAELDVNLGILRGVHFMDIGNFTVAPQFLLPIGELKTGGDIGSLTSKNGVGDLILAPTFHIIQDPSRKKSFAFTPWLFLPTGTYDHNKTFNALGENRWKLALQLGYITPISDKFTLDLIGDVTIFGDNDDYTAAESKLEQDVQFETQIHLRYHMTPGTYMAGLVSHTWGGETTIDDIKQNNAQKRTKLLFSLGHFLTPSLQVLGSFGTDITVEEGIEEDQRFNLRLVKVF